MSKCKINKEKWVLKVGTYKKTEFISWLLLLFSVYVLLGNFAFICFAMLNVSRQQESRNNGKVENTWMCYTGFTMQMVQKECGLRDENKHDAVLFLYFLCVTRNRMKQNVSQWIRNCFPSPTLLWIIMQFYVHFDALNVTKQHNSSLLPFYKRKGNIKLKDKQKVLLCVLHRMHLV